MPDQLQKPSSSAAQRQRSRAKNSKYKKLEFSKKLTIVDIITWATITLVLLIVMLVQPGIATYCVSIFNAVTAAYVSLRLGYTAKAGVENYKKIANSYSQVVNASNEIETNG